METEIAKKDRIAKIMKLTGLSREEIELVKSTIARDVTDVELGYFMQVCKSYNLSPFKKEVFGYKDHKNNLIVIAGRDGHLVAAQRDKR